MLKHDDSGLAPFGQSLDHRNGDFRRDLPDPTKTPDRVAFAWIVRRLVMGWDVDPKHIEALSSRHAAIAEALRAEPDPERRDVLFEGWKLARNDPDAIAKALLAVDPDGPFPAEEGDSTRWATLKDVRAVASAARWVWDGWIPSARIFAIAGTEGCGKTRLSLDLHRRAFHGLPWPDGQPAAVEPGRPAVWVCSDGQQDEILDTAEAFGLPDDSIVLPTQPDDPYGGTSIDEVETVRAIGSAIEIHRPWIIFVDSLSYATGLKLHEQTAVASIKNLLAGIAQTYDISICCLMHMNKDGQALGLRMRGVARTLLHLAKPDPESEKLRFWVEKSSAKKPAALGVQMLDGENVYDHSPPIEPDGDRPARRRGKPPAKTTAAVDWLRDRLTPNPQTVVALRKDAALEGVISAERSASLLYSARDVLGIEEYVLDGRTWWKLPIPDVGETDAETPY